MIHDYFESFGNILVSLRHDFKRNIFVATDVFKCVGQLIHVNLTVYKTFSFFLRGNPIFYNFEGVGNVFVHYRFCSFLCSRHEICC